MTDRSPLIGKVALVTGASRGIGLAMARALHQAGAHVAMLARSADRLMAEVKTLGSGAFGVVADLIDPQSVREAFKRTVAQFGHLDILVNNAGMAHLRRIENFSDAEFAHEIGTNILGPMYCVREAVPLMRKRGGGDIVNVSSESVRLPFPFLSVYAGTKGALETFSAGIRGELRADKIRVTVLRSGRVQSEFGRGWGEAEAAAFFKTIEASGHLAFSGEAIAAETTAQALINVVSLPREANVDLIEVRAT